MSAYMVQENHWKKLNTILFQYAISLYFSWILLDHPVYKKHTSFSDILNNCHGPSMNTCQDMSC